MNESFHSWVLNFSYYEYIEPNLLPFYEFLPNVKVIYDNEETTLQTGAASPDTTKVEVSFSPKKGGEFIEYEVSQEDFQINFKV